MTQRLKIKIDFDAVIAMKDYFLYKVQKGDTFWKIGQRFSVSPLDIYLKNAIDKPRRACPGELLKIPLKGTKPPMFYRVKEGDTLWKISREQGVPINLLIDLNGLENPGGLIKGKIIKLREKENP